MQKLWALAEAFGTLGDAAGYLLALAIWLYNRWRYLTRRRLLAARVKELQEIRPESELAVVIRVGGNADAVADAQAYLHERSRTTKSENNAGKAPSQLLIYTAPDHLDLSSPEDALQVVEDLKQAARELGKRRLTKIHLFPAGMLAYQVLVGYLISNWCDVTVYYMAGSGYRPLYEIRKEEIHRTQGAADAGRLTDPDRQTVLQVVPVTPPACP